MKRRDECLFCHRRACYERVVSTDGGETYDEVACDDHRGDLHKHSDRAAPGVRKSFISSTGKMKRGELWGVVPPAPTFADGMTVEDDRRFLELTNDLSPLHGLGEITQKPRNRKDLSGFACQQPRHLNAKPEQVLRFAPVATNLSAAE